MDFLILSFFYSHLKNAFFYYFPASRFAFVFLLFLEDLSFSELLFCVSFSVCTSMLSSIYRKNSTTSPAQISKASTCRPERDNGSNETELARANISSRIV